DPEKRLLVLNVGSGWDSRVTLWCEQVCERLSGLPGVRGATFARRLPLSDSGGGATVRIEIPGQAPLGVGFNNVAGNYFAVMGTQIVAGRGIDTNDRPGSPLSAVVSQHFAKQVFNGRNPLGEWVSIDGKKWQVVGVAGDAPANSVHESPEPFVYLPFAQAPSGDITVVVEAAGDPARLEHAVRKELKQFDSRSVVFESTTLKHHMERALLLDRMVAMLSTTLGIFGFLLTAAGLFGVIQYAVNRRTREIGLRVALGARSGEIQRMVLRESLRMAGWGIGIGLALLGIAAWSVRSFVLGVTPLNPGTYVGSAVTAALLAVIAAWWPAVRAAHVDPMAALRSE
ncbi:MAG: FtsX-like permease family protein, partial [Bryobacteraceae bacterium]